jgi:hypothetical protein
MPTPTLALDDFDLIERERELVEQSDADLIREVYDAVAKVSESDSDLSDELYWLLGEVFERYAPQLEWNERVRRAYVDNHDVGELEASMARLTERWRARLHLQSLAAGFSYD